MTKMMKVYHRVHVGGADVGPCSTLVLGGRVEIRERHVDPSKVHKSEPPGIGASMKVYEDPECRGEELWIYL